MKKPSYVTRFDYPSFRGWWARIQSHNLSKYFGDTKYGGKTAARAAALAQVKSWLRTHKDIAVRGHHQRARIGKKDVPGVSYTVTIKRTKTRGRVRTKRYYAYTANAVDPRTKKQLKRTWAVLSHGQRGAKLKAMQWRAEMVKKIDKWYRSKK
ncbi:MAG: hypothetical protein AAB304_04500 [Pseudomonadota bacterium]